MTNAEKYKEEIRAIAEKSPKAAVRDGKPVDCENIQCKECEFYPHSLSYGNAFSYCTYAYIEWLIKEIDE